MKKKTDNSMFTSYNKSHCNDCNVCYVCVPMQTLKYISFVMSVFSYISMLIFIPFHCNQLKFTESYIAKGFETNFAFAPV